MAGKSASHSEWKIQACVLFPERHVLVLYLALECKIS